MKRWLRRSIVTTQFIIGFDRKNLIFPCYFESNDCNAKLPFRVTFEILRYQFEKIYLMNNFRLFLLLEVEF